MILASVAPSVFRSHIIEVKLNQYLIIVCGFHGGHDPISVQTARHILMLTLTLDGHISLHTDYTVGDHQDAGLGVFGLCKRKKTISGTQTLVLSHYSSHAAVLVLGWKFLWMPSPKHLDQ